MAKVNSKEYKFTSGIYNATTFNELPVVSFPGFNDVLIKGDYYTALRKIGDSIVYIKSKGSLRNFYIERFNEVIEDFCETASVKKPYVQIRDVGWVKGRMPLNTLAKQGRYYVENQDELLGFITINAPSWMRVAISYGVSRFLPNMQFYLAENDKDAVTSAQQILSGKDISEKSLSAFDNSTARNVYNVSEKDIEEINKACGSLLWLEAENNQAITISENNPLKVFAETLEIMRLDLNETREIERETYEKLKAELVKAENIHKRIFPKELPDTGNYSLAAHYQPANLMGGDSYNYIKSGDTLIIYLADVMGHGFDGAMLSFFIRETVENYIFFNPDNLGPQKVLKHLDHLYRKRNFSEEHMICIFLSVIDLKTNKLKYSSAGFHAQPIIKFGDGTKARLKTGDLFISNLLPPGLNKFEEKTLQLTPGTTLFVSTDGLFEQGKGEELFMDKCADIFYELSDLPPKISVNAINKAFCRFNGNSVIADDDIAFMVLQLDNKKKRMHRLEISSSYDELEPLYQRIRSLTKSFPEQDKLRACLHEAIVNAIEHGNKNDSSKKVIIDLTISDNYVIAEVEDEGEGFDWFYKIEKPINIEGFNERGRGIAMTKLISGHFYYNNKGNKVTFLVN